MKQGVAVNASLIRPLMKAREIRIEHIAAKIDRSTSYVRNICYRGQFPKRRWRYELGVVAKMLGVQTDDLIIGEKPGSKVA